MGNFPAQSAEPVKADSHFCPTPAAPIATAATSTIRPAKFIICTGPLEDPQSEQYWMLARALAQTGHQPMLVTDSPRPESPGTWQGCAVRTWPHRPLYQWRNAAFFWRLLGEVQPQVVIASLRPNNIAIPISFLHRVPGRVAWHRNLSDQQMFDHQRHGGWQRLRNRRKGIIFRLATHVVPVSEAGRRDAIEAYGVEPRRCAKVFHTCRPDPRLRLAGQGGAAKASAGTSIKRIVNIGRVVHSKGLDLLLRAIQKLHIRNPSWTLEFIQIGKGPQLAELKQLAHDLGLADQVQFLGHLPQDLAFPQIAAADVLALPFRSDPGPGVIPEGLGLGVPIITCAVGGIAELFKESDAIRLIPPENVETLAEALHDVLSDPALAGRMSRNGRQLFEEKFLLDYWVRDVQSWLENTVLQSVLTQK